MVTFVIAGRPNDDDQEELTCMNSEQENFQHFSTLSQCPGDEYSHLSQPSRICKHYFLQKRDNTEQIKPHSVKLTDAAETVSNWHNRREYADDSGSDEPDEGLNPTSPRRARPGTRARDMDDEDYIPTNLKLVIVLSGKRKSGKDHISTLLTNYIGYQRMRHLAVLRIAGPIKSEFAKNNKLDFTRLLDSSDYKENFRMAMVDWSEGYREREGWNCFLKLAIREQRAKDKAIWILNDARRPCDLEYFDSEPSFADTRVIKLRIEATEEARMSRGWKFVQGIDDRPTECGLDDYEDWTYVLENNYNDRREEIQAALKPIFEEIDKALVGLYD